MRNLSGARLVAAITVAVGLVLVLGTFAVHRAVATVPMFGDPLPGLTAGEMRLFQLGLKEFNQPEEVGEGLGPVFNAAGCAQCHSNPAVGGDSTITETRFGRLRADGSFDPMTEFGGSLIQTQGIDLGHKLDPDGICLAGETVPREATIQGKRRTTPLFGLGLVDNVPDALLESIASSQRRFAPSVAGRPHRLIDVFSKKPRVGRFGWKAQVATLETFSGDAYLNEMGITNPLFPTENLPQGDAHRRDFCDTVTDLEDDGTGVQRFADFMRRLGAPPRDPITPQVLAGELVFAATGCVVCHVPALVTGPSSIPALDRVTFQPFSDFLLHDMGSSLGDGIGQGDAGQREMRTAPLWGIRKRTTFLHDGRATTIAEAIAAHDGQGKAASISFARLSPTQQANLLAFLGSL